MQKGTIRTVYNRQIQKKKKTLKLKKSDNVRPTRTVGIVRVDNLDERNLTFMSFPGLPVTSCLAMSAHRFASFGVQLSVSQFRFAVCAYKPAGEACVTLLVDTNPTALPRSIDHSAMDRVLFSGANEPAQSFSSTLAVSPIVS